jgi:DNA (cytosine-5)-methyltransferase 1
VNHLSLFTGIGGFDLAARWAGIATKVQVEKDKFCLKILEKNFPNARRYKDIKEFNGLEYRGRIDIISASPPCQPFSTAGQGKGNKDERDLFGESTRVISEVMPSWCIVENVYGYISPKFATHHNTFCESLESLGYDVQTYDIDASSCGLSTMERHIWIIATTNGVGLQGSYQKKIYKQQSQEQFQRTDKIEGRGWYIPESEFCRVDKRVSKKLDKFGRDRLKALGNAIVPQIAYEIFKSIKEIT